MNSSKTELKTIKNKLQVTESVFFLKNKTKQNKIINEQKTNKIKTL